MVSFQDVFLKCCGVGIVCAAIRIQMWQEQVSQVNMVMSASWTTAMCMNINLVTKESLCRPVSRENGRPNARCVFSILFSMLSARFYFLLLLAPGGSFRQGADTIIKRFLWWCQFLSFLLWFLSWIDWTQRGTLHCHDQQGERDTR